VRAVAVDAAGAIHVAGAEYGRSRGIVRMYDGTGSEVWTRRLGTGLTTVVGDLAVDGAGNVVVGGWATGSLEGASRGKQDAFVTSHRP
jgi:hypothetical protein